MAAAADVHPPKEQLVAFGLGKLEPNQATQIEQHLEGCPDCCETILDLADDTFVGLVRKCDAAVAQSDLSGATIEASSGSQPALHTPTELPPALKAHDRYEIQELIGRGGMGDVYKAQHKVMNRVVALKVIKPQLVKNEAAVQRFRREVQAAASLHHKHIVTAYDAEQAGELHFLVMEFVPGVNLDEVIRQRGPLPVAEACNYIRQAAEGLQHAHELGMVHRDIKPHNLMVSGLRIGDCGLRIEEDQESGAAQSAIRNPKSEIIKILDFGLAGFATEVAEEEIRADNTQSGVETAAALHQLTQMGTMMGTPDYVAPEQAANAHKADIRADIYSLGCTLFTLLAGKAPFGEGSVLEKIKAHAQAEPPAISQFRSDVPPQVEAILRKMLAKDPAERYQTPAEVAAALEQWTACKPPSVAAKRERARRRPLVLTAVAATLTAIAAGVIIYLATDTGMVEINDNPDIPGARIVLLKDGDEYAAFDVEPGVKKQRIRAGKYEVVLRDAPQGVDLNVRSTKDGKPQDFGAPYDPQGKRITVYRGGGMSIEIRQQGPQVAGSGSGSPRSSTPVSADSQGTFKLLAELPGHTNVVRAVRFLPGNERLVSVDGNGNVIEWDATTRRIARRFKVPGETYSDADISADGRLLAVGSDWGTTKGRLEIWDIERGAVLHRLTHRFNNIEQMRLSPDGNKLVVVGRPPVAVLWDIATGKELQTIESGLAPDQQLKSGAFTPDGGMVVVGSPGRVHVLEVETGAAKHKIDLSSPAMISDLAFSPSTRQLAAIKGDGSVALIDTATWSIIKTLPNAASGQVLRSGAFVSDDLLVTGSDQGFLYLRKLDGTVEATAQCGTGSCLNVSVSSDARHVVTAGGWFYANKTRQWSVTSDFKLRLWRLPESVWPAATLTADDIPLDGKFSGHTSGIKALRFLAEDKQFVSIGGDKTLRKWNLATKEAEITDLGDRGSIGDADFSAAGDVAAITSPRVGSTFLWDVAAGKGLTTISDPAQYPERVNLSRDGAQVLLSGTPGYAVLRDSKTGEELQELSMREPRLGAAVLSSNGEQALLASGREARLLRTDNGKLVRGYGLFSQSESCAAAFSADGEKFAVGHTDGTISLWNATDQHPLNEINQSTEYTYKDGLRIDRPLESVQHRVTHLQFTSGDRFLLAAFDNGAVRIWAVEGGRLAARCDSPAGCAREVAISADGKLLLTGGGEIWNQKQGKLESTAHNDIFLWRLPESVWPKSVDLLAQIDPAQHALDGGISKKDGILYTPRGGQNTVVMIPYRPEPQEEYDIRLVAEKTDSEGNGLNLGLVMGGRQAHLAMGGGGKKAAWTVERIDGKSMHDGNITCVEGLPWPLNQKVSVLMQVRQDGVRVLRNGKEIINWQGRPEQLSLWDRIVLPDPQSLFFFSQAEFAIHELTLIPAGSTSEVVGRLPESVVPKPGPQDAALTEDQIEELVSEAAGIPNDDWTKLASGTEAPSPDSLESQTLSLMLFSLRALPPAGIESELPAIANLKKDFQYLPEHTPKPAEIARALWISRTKGYASYIQPEYVTEVTVNVTGDTARGEVAFEKEKLYRGRVRYVARRVNGDWRIEEFHLPNVGLSLQLSEPGVWKRLIRAQSEDSP